MGVEMHYKLLFFKDLDHPLDMHKEKLATI